MIVGPTSTAVDRIIKSFDYRDDDVWFWTKMAICGNTRHGLAVVDEIYRLADGSIRVTYECGMVLEYQGGEAIECQNKKDT